jgi:hypothetical protein
MKIKPSPKRPELDGLIEAANGHAMTPAEIWDQRVSFTFGNCSIENPRITRESVIAMVTKIYGPRPSH